MNIKDLVDTGVKILKDSNIKNPILDAEIILSSIIKKERDYIQKSGIVIKKLSGDDLNSSIWDQFGSHFSYQSGIFSRKSGFPKQTHNQEQFVFDFCAISVTLGP